MKRFTLLIVLAIVIGDSVFSQEFDKKNLLFRVNPNDDNTVELLGFQKKPKEELVIPEEVSYKGTKYVVSKIGSNAFRNCEVLKKVVGITIQDVEESAFAGCRNLSSVVFTNQLTTLGKSAFQECTSLQEIVLGDNILCIEDAAFTGCISLKEIAFGNSLKTIGAGIINETGITNITLPSSLTNVGHDAFACCKLLSSITLSEGIKSIEANGFRGISITTLNIPTSLESIGENAFADCINLQTISFSEGLKSINSGAFTRTGVINLQFPNSLKNICTGSFEDCKSLQSITLGNDLESIGKKAFAGCSLLSVDYSDVPCDIANDAFVGCKEAIIGDYSLKLLAKLLKERNLSFVEKIFLNSVLQVSQNGKFGFINKMGKLVIPCIYDKVERDDNIIIVKKDSKFGLYSLNGELKAQCLYDKIVSYGVDSLRLVKKNGKYGCIDINGKEIIPCIYDELSYIGEGFAFSERSETGYILSNNGKTIAEVPNVKACSGFKDGISTLRISYYDDDNYKIDWAIVDKDGKFDMLLVGDNRYFPPLPCGYGFIQVEIDGKLGLIDKEQNVILPAVYDKIGQFQNGLAIIKKDDKEGVIDSTGRVFIPCNYESISDFYDGYATIRDKGKEWYINKYGNILDVDFINSLKDYNDIAIKKGICIANKNGKYGCINIKGDIIIPYNYDVIDVGTCDEGVFIVTCNKKMGYIDMNGKVISPCIYDDALDFCEGLAKVEKDSLLYFIDRSGKVVFRLDDGSYDNYFRDGMLRVFKYGKYGYIDNTGKLAVPCLYNEEKYNKEDGSWTIKEHMEGFSEGLACVKKGGKIGFVDKKGKSTFDFE